VVKNTHENSHYIDVGVVCVMTFSEINLLRVIIYSMCGILIYAHIFDYVETIVNYSFGFCLEVIFEPKMGYWYFVNTCMKSWLLVIMRLVDLIRIGLDIFNYL
jgi:hypothetical protein